MVDRSHLMYIRDNISTNLDEVASVARQKLIVKNVISYRNGIDKIIDLKKKSSFRLNSISFSKSKSQDSLSEKKTSSTFETVADDECCSFVSEDTNGNEGTYKGGGTITPVEEGSFPRSMKGSLRKDLSQKSITSIGSTSTKSVYKLDTCFICLEPYKEGETIYRSPNEKCIHSFHSTCMMRWLLDHDDCPVCREDFLNIRGTTDHK